MFDLDFLPNSSALRQRWLRANLGGRGSGAPALSAADGVAAWSRSVVGAIVQALAT
jgi:hypothetical protein